MIYTFTPNPAIDYYIDLNDFRSDTINRVDRSFFRVAGKGINCSHIFELFDIPNTACYFAGGFTGDHITSELNGKKYTEAFPIEIEGESRINIKFIGRQDTAINASGPVISEKAKSKLFDYVSKLGDEDYFINSGSLPLNFTKRELMNLCRKINDSGSRLILDVPGLRIKDIRDIDVYLIKPNLNELGMLFDETISLVNYHDYIDRLFELNVRNVLLSLGKDGSYYAGEYGRYSVYVPDVEVFSTVGSGDSLLAGFIAGLVQGKGIEDTLRLASACSVAKVMNESLDSQEKIKEICDRISVISE